jgi:hypothetical protein
MQSVRIDGGASCHVVVPCRLRVSLPFSVGLRASGTKIPAPPSMPQLEDLADKSYDALISSSAATSATSGLSGVSMDTDTLPLIAGLVVGIALVGGALYVATGQGTAPAVCHR